jgi:hypothetical protein
VWKVNTVKGIGHLRTLREKWVSKIQVQEWLINSLKISPKQNAAVCTDPSSNNNINIHQNISSSNHVEKNY